MSKNMSPDVESAEYVQYQDLEILGFFVRRWKLVESENQNEANF